MSEEELVKKLLEKDKKGKEMLKEIEEIINSEEFKNLFFQKENIEDVLKSILPMEVFSIRFLTEIKGIDYKKLPDEVGKYLQEKIKEKFPDHTINLYVFIDHPKEEKKLSYYS